MFYAAAFSVFLKKIGLASSNGYHRAERGLNTFKRNAQLKEFSNDFREVFKKFIVVSSISFDPFFECSVLQGAQLRIGETGILEQENNQLATS